MFKYVALSVLACAATSTMVNAWGENGHSAVGILMQRLLNPTTLKNIQRLLDEDTDVKGDFGRAATWADRIKSKGELYRWASPLHYVDIACGVYKEEDCPNGVCIISGIANYTKRMEAIKFLIHFLGDIGQPLHATGEARGGNDFHCLWQGKKSNLHSVWDGKILDTTINGQFNAYIDSIEKDIRTGKYANEKANWLNCFNNANNVDLKACTIAWANESNKFN
ncbi:phospholipase C/P1 nuclease domain-containing protein, partial [Syncephalis plumigaleata]